MKHLLVLAVFALTLLIQGCAVYTPAYGGYGYQPYYGGYGYGYGYRPYGYYGFGIGYPVLGLSLGLGHRWGGHFHGAPGHWGGGRGWHGHR